MLPDKIGKFIASYPWRWCWTCPGKWPFWSWWWHCHGCAAPADFWACWGACPWVHSWTGRDAAAWSGGWGPCCGWHWSCCSPGSESVWKGQGEKVLLLHTFDPRCLRVMDGQLQFFRHTSLFLFKGLLDFEVLKLEPWDPHSEALKLHHTASQHMFILRGIPPCCLACEQRQVDVKYLVSSHTSYTTLGSAPAVRRLFIGKIGKNESSERIGE